MIAEAINSAGTVASVVASPWPMSSRKAARTRSSQRSSLRNYTNRPAPIVDSNLFAKLTIKRKVAKEAKTQEEFARDNRVHHNWTPLPKQILIVKSLPLCALASCVLALDSYCIAPA